MTPTNSYQKMIGRLYRPQCYVLWPKKSRIVTVYLVALTHVPPYPRRWFSTRTTGFLMSGARRPRLGRYHHDERHLSMARMGYIAIGSERRSLEGATGLPTLVVFTATQTRYLGAYPAFSCRGLPATRPVLLSMRTTSGGRAWRNTHLP